MTISDLQNKKVAILGFGVEGQAIAKYLVRADILPVIFDQTSVEEWEKNASDIANSANLKIRTGKNYLESLQDYDIIFRSPGFWRLDPTLLAAEKAGAIVTSQTKWFFENAVGFTIGVTGTKGKGTTCSLIESILQSAQNAELHHPGNIYLTGNIGKIQPFDFIDDLKPYDTIIYELSSFQLQDVTTSPDIGVCLMTTSDHLDKHNSLAEYHRAKSAICKYQTSEQVCIYNIDYAASKKIGEQGAGIKMPISNLKRPQQGAFIEADKNQITIIGDQIATINVNHRNLSGAHNLENIAAAALVCLQKNVPVKIITSAANAFKGLVHRLQFVDTINGISFYNDSIATTPDSTVAAIQSFSEPLILLLGGSDKGVDYTDLIAYIMAAPNIKAIITIGETGGQIFSLLQSHNFLRLLISQPGNFAECMRAAVSVAEYGDVVLLSPASASFDMF